MTVELSSEMRLLVCAGGIFFFYLYYGVLQEKLYRPEPSGERFDVTMFLLFVQCLVNCLVAVAGIGVFGYASAGSKPAGEASTKAPFPFKVTGVSWMAVLAMSYLCAMGCSNSALKFVSYPTQALGKSCKMIPVMLGNVLMGKKYSVREYGCVVLITAGICVFQLYKAGKGGSFAESSSYGVALLFASLCLDGLTSSNQRLIRDEYKPSTHAMMFQLNAWSVLYLFVALMVTGEGTRGLAYMASHPHILRDLMIFSGCSAMGQNFIFFTVTGPGPLACTMITTLRKFFTILCSVLLFPDNVLATEQWGGVALVFTGLAGELGGKYQSKYGAAAVAARKEKKKVN